MKPKVLLTALGLVFGVIAILWISASNIPQVLAEKVSPPNQGKVFDTVPITCQEAEPIRDWNCELSVFEGAVYVHNFFSPAKVPGTIDGESSYALQCGESISTAQCSYYGIYFTNNPDADEPPVIQRQARSDYASLWSELKIEANSLCYISNNDNAKIIDPLAHDSSNCNKNLPVKDRNNNTVGI